MPIRLQSDAEGASKQSTVFMGVDPGGAGGWATLAVDTSQRFTDFTAGLASITEASPASRFNLGFPRTIGAVLQLDNTSAGLIFSHSSAGTLLRLDISPAGTLRATNNGAVVGDLAIPGLSGSASQYVLAWVARRNPLTTGPGDAVQSWLLAYDVSGAELARVEFHHVLKSHSIGIATWGGCSSSTFEAVWFASAAQAATEILRDWGFTSPSAPSSLCDLDLPPVPLDTLSEAPPENALYGPVPQWAAVHVRHAMRRHWSPLANIVYRSQPELRAGGAGNIAYRLAPGSTGYQMAIGWLAPAPVPPGATHAWVRLHVRSWVTSGAAVPLGLRVYLMSRLPDDPEGGDLEHHQVGEVVTRDDAGGGEWCIHAIVELAVGSDGWTYICPAYQVDPAGVSANDANARIQIRALHVVPCVRE